MTWFEVLVEGVSDVPAISEVLTRRFGLVDGEHFRIHPHQGRGRLPPNPLARPDPKQRQLLHQLPAKLRGYAKSMADDAVVLVVVDVDDTPCKQMLEDLRDMLSKLPARPKRVLFRLAIEETESWFIADPAAVQAAFPRANIAPLRKIQPDAIIGAWEALAAAIGASSDSSGTEKLRWARLICPYLDLSEPASPSLRKLIAGIARELEADAP